MLLTFALDLPIMPDNLTQEIIGAAIKIHRKLGPGLLESTYEACLAYELEKLGFRVERQKAVPLVYETVKMECGFRADIVVEGKVVIELKLRGLYMRWIRLSSCHISGCWIYPLAC